MGERLVVQPARGSDRTRERRDNDYPPQRAGPRPRRTVHRMTMTGLPDGASWQVRKIFLCAFHPCSMRSFSLG